MTEFWNLYPLYMSDPPLQVDPTDNVIKRHKGGLHRSAFWAGYDGLKGGIYPPPTGSVAESAYRAGKDYRAAVDSGAREPLPL